MDGFRELQRKDKKISEDECVELLIKEKRGVLAVLGDGGYPYCMPMNHYYNPADGCIYFHTGKSGHRLDSLAKSDKVSLCVFEDGTSKDGEWAKDVRSVIVFGKIELITDREKTAEITAALSRKFTADEDYINKEIKAFLDATLLLKLTPEHVSGKRVRES